MTASGGPTSGAARDFLAHKADFVCVSPLQSINVMVYIYLRLCEHPAGVEVNIVRNDTIRSA